MYTALMEMDVPTRMCLFHGENYELSRSGKPPAPHPSPVGNYQLV